MWRTSWQTCLLCPWARHLTGRLRLYMADKWSTRTSPGYSCKIANPACRKRRLFGTHQWQSALLVVGLLVTLDWFEMGRHLFLNCRSCRSSILRKRRGNYNNNIRSSFMKKSRTMTGKRNYQGNCKQTMNEMLGNQTFKLGYRVAESR